MAINKTIDPTNVTVQVPAMADKPNQATNSNCLDKIIDGINALNSKTTAELGIYGNRVQNAASTDNAMVTKRGNVCVITGYIEYLVSPTSSQTSVLTIPSGYAPTANTYTTVARESDGKTFIAQVSSSGNVNIFNRGEISTGNRFYLGITYVV